MLSLVSVSLSLAAANPPVAPDEKIVVTDPAGVLAVLLTVLAIIFYLAQHPVVGKFFKVIPALVFCYFVPTALATADIIPNESPLYDFVKTWVLPASLLLLILALDLPGILRLGPKAGIMLLAGTFGVVIGGPIALWIVNTLFPGELSSDIWRGLSALCGSWIGGGANFVALGRMAEASDSMIAMMVIPDVFVANIWMAVLLFAAGQQLVIDKFTGADASAIRDLEQRLADFQARTARVPNLTDLMIILALGFGLSWATRVAGVALMKAETGAALSAPLGFTATTWTFVFITTIGLILSFTPARNLDGAGASKVGSVMIYLLVATIGAHASFDNLREYWALITVALIWMAIHITVLLTVGWLIKAPIFFVAVGSQANIGGAASAPVVASAFHPSLAPVGALLAVAGYVLGTYAGLICMAGLKWASGAM